jgi:hypothetical protein
MEEAASAKRSHSSVEYEHPSRHEGKECRDCVHYIGANPPRCTGVQSPIRPVDYCKRFERKSRIGEAMKRGK